MSNSIFHPSIHIPVIMQSVDPTHITADPLPIQVPLRQRTGTSVDDLPLLLSVANVSEVLGIGRNSTYQLLRSGRLRSIRIGRLIKVPRQALIDYLQAY